MTCTYSGHGAWRAKGSGSVIHVGNIVSLNSGIKSTNNKSNLQGTPGRVNYEGENYIRKETKHKQGKRQRALIQGSLQAASAVGIQPTFI